MSTTQTKQNSVHTKTPSTVLGGKCRREAQKIWIDLAESEARANMIGILVKEGIAVNEVEEFELGIINKFKSTKFKNSKNPKVTQDLKNRLVVPVMKAKLADEQCFMRELRSLREKYRREMTRIYGKNTNQYRQVISKFRQEAKEAKNKITEKYKNKIAHLRRKNNARNPEEEEQEAPEDIQEYYKAKIFNKKWYDDKKIDSYEVKIVGNIELSQEEKAVLTMHPKFCIVDKLVLSDFEHEQEAALAKLRMEIVQEQEHEGLTPEEIQEVQESEARTKQVYDPLEKKYDAKRRRATDLQECARITLPKPLGADEEANLEIRKKSQQEIFKKYIDKNTDKNGKLKSNLSKSEEVGLKSLKKRIKTREIIIMKTDKSTKMVVTTPQEYTRIGYEPTRKDREINRQELIEIEEKPEWAQQGLGPDLGVW